jgi:hypothetical protein
MGISKVQFLLGTSTLAQMETAKGLDCPTAASKSCIHPFLCQSCIHAKQCVQTPENCKKHFTVHDDHSGVHWPEVANTALWLMAVDHAVFFWNHVLDPATGLSPTDLFPLTG